MCRKLHDAQQYFQDHIFRKEICEFFTLKLNNDIQEHEKNVLKNLSKTRQIHY